MHYACFNTSSEHMKIFWRVTSWLLGLSFFSIVSIATRAHTTNYFVFMHLHLSFAILVLDLLNYLLTQLRLLVVGVIIFYELWLKSEAESKSRLVFNPSGQFDPLGLSTVLPPPPTTYTVYGLQPFTQYHLQVVAENALGKTSSDFAPSRTAEAGMIMLSALFAF